ncbi:ferredoxin-2, mitochondrial isoform X4 [Ursus arctos]|uniref:ferredoxin-2, mitochondrial isoform X4 n=1 Tax=Ursus arctos TaxID=9644 RepID=UPI001CF92441|nr:ferredoxin-2, mitochondrial isoform X4 [Ursus arctos]
MAWVGSLGRPGRSFVWVRPPGSLPRWQSLPGVLPRMRPPQTTVLIFGQLRAFWSRGCHWACPVPGHVMPVMAASVARGGVSAGFLLRAARGAWWSRPGGSRGSGEAATPVTARRFRATGSRQAGEEEAGGPERPGDVPPNSRRDLATAPTIKFGICTPICPQGERGVRRPVRPTDSRERQSGGQCSPPGPAPWSGPGRHTGFLAVPQTKSQVHSCLGAFAFAAPDI